jgi:TPR repeat protein
MQGVQLSTKYPGDSLFRKKFYDCYRCQLCGFRFWQINRVSYLQLLGLFFSVIMLSGAAGFLFRAWEPSAKAIALHDLNTTRELAAKGNAYAELQMSLRYGTGDGVAKDSKEAFQWLEKSANQNQSEAQYLLGIALLDGQGTEKNIKRAFYWLEQSALRGYIKSQLKLGDIYGSGMTDYANKSKAFLWFSLAADHGVEEAIYARDLLANQLDVNELSIMDKEIERIKRNQSLRH